MIARRAPGGMVTVPDRPYVVIPAALRRRYGLRGAGCGSVIACYWHATPVGARELMLRQDTPLAADVKDTIAARLDAAQERFAVIEHGHGGEDDAEQSADAQPASL
jgi:hypothetical protein